MAGADGAKAGASRKPQDNVTWKAKNYKLGYSVSRKLKALILKPGLQGKELEQ